MNGKRTIEIFSAECPACESSMGGLRTAAPGAVRMNKRCERRV
jgi:hypothetical protein